MTPNQRVVATAARYVGVRENPMGSNRGPLIDRWEAVPWGMRGEPWCGMFASAVLRESNVTDVSHPATAVICSQGRERGWIVPQRDCVPGALIVWCGTHVAIAVECLSPQTSRSAAVWATIEGNSGDMVARRTRSLDGTTIVVAPELRGGGTPKPAPTYWLEDPAAQPRLVGPWRTRAARDRAVAGLPVAVRSRARLVRTPQGRYAALLGPRRLYGGWPTRDARDAARAVLERRLGRTLRPFMRQPRRAPVAADAIGKTT